MSEVTLQTLMELDFVTVTDLTDEDHLSAEMEVVNAAEVLVGEETGLYVLVSDTAGVLDDEDEEEEEGEAEEDSDEADAYIFKVCAEEDAEFLLSEDYSDVEVYVTTNFSEEEFREVAGIFQDTAEDFDITVED